MGLSRTGSEACLVYTVLGTLGRRAGPPSALVGGPLVCCFDPAIVHVRSCMVHDGIKFEHKSSIK